MRPDIQRSSTSLPGWGSPVLLASVFVIACSGLVYELLAGTLSSYLLGNSVTQFSLVIGLFLSAMGLGSFLSRFVGGDLVRTFLAVEIAIGGIGGCSALVLFTLFASVQSYTPFLVLFSVVIGTLVGLEIPLLIRILKNRVSLKTTVGNVLALDYAGALGASLLFPLVCVPWLGLIRSGFLFGLMNTAVALVGLRLFRRRLRGAVLLHLAAVVVAVLLSIGLFTASRATSLLEDMIYDDEIIYAQSTPYQRLVITRWRGDIRLFIDGNIQFSSADEFRYHESLVHVPLTLISAPRKVLILGGGDGLAAREVLKHQSVQHVDLVDLDGEITKLFSTQPLLTALNKGALRNSRVTVHNADAQKFLEQNNTLYDVIIIDLPDPNNESLSKLYTRSFYRLVARSLTPRGVFVTQATSPFYATSAYWCIANTISATTMSSAGGQLYALPYHVNVPSFGEWGFVLGSRQPLHPPTKSPGVSTRFLNARLIPTLFVFPSDIAWRQTELNQLDNQVLVRYYEQGYKRYNQ